MRIVAWYLAVLCLCALPARAQAVETAILEDDFSGEQIDTEKWVVGVPKTEGSFARIEEGVAHLLGRDAGPTLRTRAEIPSEHMVEFDYYQPSDERSGGYQNSVSFQVTKKAEGQEWSGAAWYIEASGAAYSYRDGLWGMRSGAGAFPPSSDRWWRIQVFNQATSTVIIARDRESGELSYRISFQHDPALAGTVRFTAGAMKGGRWGFKLDNVRILSVAPELGEPLAPLVAPRQRRMPGSWQPLAIAARTFWHLAPYQADKWDRWGMSELPLFAEAAWLHAPADEELLAGTERPFTLRPPRGEVDTENYERIAEAAGDCFLGFYGPLNEWGDWALRTDKGDRFSKQIANRDEGLAELERLYIGRADSVPIKRAIFSLNGYRIFHHHAFEWGARAVIAEIGEMIPCTNLQLAFARGAAREYAGPWGVDLSSWFWNPGTMTNYVYTPDFLTSNFGPFSGHSVSLHKRFSYAAWLAGANYIWYENRNLLVVNENDARQLFGYPPDEEHDRWILSPVGEIAQRLFRIAREKDRGTPMTPVALMVDFAHGWSPKGCTPHKIWARLPLSKGDHMLDEFFNTIYPWNPARDYGTGGAHSVLTTDEQGYLNNTPHGDIFDVFTNRSSRTLDGYPVVILVGDIRVDEALAERLAAYARGGGTLVINAEQVGEHLGADLLGAELTGEVGSAEAATCLVGQETLTGAAFDYAKVRLTTARPLVTAADSGDVLACANAVGEGQVILTTPAYLLDRENRALPMLGHLLERLVSGLLPVRVSPGVEYLVNRTPDGWLVGLINNKGVYKRPHGPPEIRPEEQIAVKVSFDGAAESVEEWLTGEMLSTEVGATETSVTLTVPAGDVRLVHFLSG